MTIREFLAARRRNLMIVGFAAWLGFAGSAFLGSRFEIPWLPFVFFALFGAVILLLFFWLKCPRCGGTLGAMNASFTKGGRFMPRCINYCPYCGVSLDEPTEKRV
jgi:hypothetical protein